MKHLACGEVSNRCDREEDARMSDVCEDILPKWIADILSIAHPLMCHLIMQRRRRVTRH
jgi:hypothetical protein